MGMKESAQAKRKGDWREGERERAKEREREREKERESNGERKEKIGKQSTNPQRFP